MPVHVDTGCTVKVSGSQGQMLTLRTETSTPKEVVLHPLPTTDDTILCQFGWAMVPHMWSNIILHLSMRVFLEEINI